MAAWSSSSCLLLLFLLLTAWLSFAQALQYGDVADTEQNTVSTEKGVLEGEPKASVHGASSGVVAGRKVLIDRRRTEQEDVRKTRFVDAAGKSTLFSDDQEEAAGFVAFNADYHAPRHHPPKNN